MAFGTQVVPILGISVEQLIFFLYPSLLIPAIFLWFRELRRHKQSQLHPQGYIKLGIRGPSNVRDEYDKKYITGLSQRDGSTGNSTWRVKALFIHPVKSCAGIEVDAVDIDRAGMVHDRKFAFAELLKPQTRLDASEEEKQPKWTFRTLRQPGFEKLVHVRPEIWLGNAKSTVVGNEAAEDGLLIMKYPHIPSGPLAVLDRLMISLGFMSPESSFHVPLIPPPNHRYPVEEVTIWKDAPKWLNYGTHLPDEFRTYLGVKNPLTLFRADPQSYRQVFRCAPRKEKVGYQPVVGFADAYPIHLLNLASVRDVGEKVKSDIPKFTARRFRSNILISGPEAYNEDDWKRIRIGKHEIYCACHTIRCRLPNVDPDSSFRHPVEPDKTLKSFRCIDDGDPKNAALGLQLVPAVDTLFQIHVGDSIEVLERGEHHYIKQ